MSNCKHTRTTHAHAEGATTRDRQRLTQAIHSLSMHCRRLSERHRAMRYVDVVAEEDRQ